MEIDRCLCCMEELTGGVRVCPSCGYDNSKKGKYNFSLRPGTILYGRYLVGNILGLGGFGMTYIGYDLRFEIKVAIKEYYPRVNASRNNAVSNTVRWSYSDGNRSEWLRGCESFLKEARKMVKIDSIPGIVRIRDNFIENDTAYIVMDYVDGITFKEFVKKGGPMKYSVCLSLMKPLMEGLEKAHAAGIIHRDLSPDNIMLLKDGGVRLLDLGAAKDLNVVNSSGESELVAKKGFSPPEQYLAHGEIGPWTDVYAMCSTIYYLITGKVLPDAIERMMDDKMTFDVPMTEPLPKSVKNALAKGLAVKAKDRTKSMRELMDSLYASTNIENAKYDKSFENKIKEIFGPSAYIEGSSDSKVKRWLSKGKRKAFVAAAAVILAAALAVSAFFSVTSYNKHHKCGENISWKVKDGTLFISGSGEMDNYEMEDEENIKKYPWPDDITDIVISDGITSVGTYAFYDCDDLKSVQFGNDVSVIGYNAFDGCSKLINVKFPDSVSGIGDWAFWDCDSLIKVDIGKNVTIIGKYVFGGADNISEINVDENNANYVSIDGVLFNRDVTTLISMPLAKTGEYVVPSGVTSIEPLAFSYSKLSSVTLPDTVQVIGRRAFLDCRNLKSLSMYAGVTSIGEDAFSDGGRILNLYFYGTPEQWEAIDFKNEEDKHPENIQIYYVQ